MIPASGVRRTSERLQEKSSCPDFVELPEETQKELAVEAVEKMGFGPEHTGLWFDGTYPAIEKPLKMITSASGGARSVIMGGPLGVGKTAYLSAMVKELFLHLSKQVRGKAYILPAMFAFQWHLVTHQELIDVLVSEFRDEPTCDFSLDDLKRAKLLLVDDLGRGKESEFNLSKLEDLIDFRWCRGLPTWITTNISAKDLSKRPGWERIYSRFADRKWMVWLEIGQSKGSDRRINGRTVGKE